MTHICVKRQFIPKLCFLEWKKNLFLKFLLVCICPNSNSYLPLTLLFTDTSERHPGSFKPSHSLVNCSLIPHTLTKLKGEKQNRCLDVNAVVDVVGRILDIRELMSRAGDYISFKGSFIFLLLSSRPSKKSLECSERRPWPSRTHLTQLAVTSRPKRLK